MNKRIRHLVLAVLLSLVVTGAVWAQEKVTLTIVWQNAGVDSTDNWMRDTLTLPGAESQCRVQNRWTTPGVTNTSPKSHPHGHKRT